MSRRKRVMDYSEPFTPLDDRDTTPAHLRITARDDESLVDQYFLINSQIKRLNQTRSILRSKIAEMMRDKIEANERGELVAEVSGKTVKVSPRNKVTLDKQAALRVFKANGLLDRVAVKVLHYRVKPSLSISFARRIWSLIERWGLAESVDVSFEWEFDEEEIERLYHARRITDEEIDEFVKEEPDGQGYALYVVEAED